MSPRKDLDGHRKASRVYAKAVVLSRGDFATPTTPCPHYQGTFAMSGDIFGGHDLGRSVGEYHWHLGTETRDVPKHSVMHRTVPHPSPQQRVIQSQVSTVPAEIESPAGKIMESC